MIHTVELSSLLTYNEYKHLNSLGSELKNKLSGYGIRNIHIEKQDFNDKYRTREKLEYNSSYNCSMRVNLARVANDGMKTTELFVKSTDQITKLYDNFAKFMSLLLPSKSDLSRWKLMRVDYCIDIKTEFVETYIKLFQRGNKPWNMNLPETYAKEQHKALSKCTHRDGSVYYKNGSTHINIYDKHKQRKIEMELSGFVDERNSVDLKIS